MSDIRASITAAEGAVDYEAGAQRLEEEARRLANLPLAERAVQRKDVAKRCGIPASVLDVMVKQFSDKGDGETDPNGGGLFNEIAPWPERVSGEKLLDDLAALFDRHMVLPPSAADAVALWTMFTHCHDAASISPILAITSPAPECGKTTLITLLSGLTPRAMTASNITAAALFRTVEKWSPTILVDEADTFLRNSDELRGVINSGHNKAGASIIRTVGDDHEPRRFRTWAPKAIALIGKLPPTLASRSIHIELRRMSPGEKAEEVRSDRLDFLTPFAQRAARWAADNIQAVARIDPVMPPGIRGRAADNWRSLCAVAEAVGGEWPARAHAAALALTATDSEQTAGIMLLQDLRAMFVKTDKLTSEEIERQLGAMEDRPWPEWRNGKPITKRQVAKLLEPFKVTPGTIRTEVGTAKGYRESQLADVFASYLPDDPSQRHNTRKTAKNADSDPSHPDMNVTDRKHEKPRKTAGCDGVTDRIGGEGGSGPNCGSCGAPLDPAERGVSWLIDNGQPRHKDGLCR